MTTTARAHVSPALRALVHQRLTALRELAGWLGRVGPSDPERSAINARRARMRRDLRVVIRRLEREITIQLTQELDL